MPSFESEPPLVPPPLLPTPSGRSPTEVLLGPLGLRAGWGILLYLLLALMLGTGLLLGIAKETGRLAALRAEGAQNREVARVAKATGVASTPAVASLATTSISEFSQAGAVLLAGVGLALLERRRFGVYGLPAWRLRDIVPGALWGLIAVTALLTLLRLLHLLVFDRQLLHGAAALRSGLLWLITFLLVGFFEEFLFRGYLQFTLMRGVLGLARRWFPAHERAAAFCFSAIVWSTLFFLTHLTNSGENASGLAGVFLAGVLFSFALWRTGALWWGVGFHMTWDWGQSFLFGVPDSGILSQGRLFATHATGRPVLSGGVDGPEGSLLLIPIFLLMFLVIRLRPQAAQPPVEPQP